MEITENSFLRLVPMDQELPTHEFGLVDREGRFLSGCLLKTGDDINIIYTEPLILNSSRTPNVLPSEPVQILSVCGILNNANLHKARLEVQEEGRKRTYNSPSFPFMVREEDKFRVVKK